MTSHVTQDASERVYDLSDCVVLGVGKSLSGRVLLRLLADQGASLTSVLASDAPLEASAETWDDGVPSTALELHTEAGQKALSEAIAKADVVVAQLDSPLHSLAPAIRTALLGKIYVEFRDYPEGAPAAKVSAPWQVSADAGLFRASTTAPAYVEQVPIPDIYAALQAATYIGCLLLSATPPADVDGWMEISRFGATVQMIGSKVIRIGLQYPDPYSGDVVPVGERYLCGDDRWIQPQAQSPSVARGLMAALGHPEWWDEVVSGLTGVDGPSAVADWYKRFEELFQSRPALVWEAAIAAAGGAAAMCRTPDEWFAEQHVADAEIIVADSSENPLRPDHRRIGPAFRVSAMPPARAGSRESKVEHAQHTGGLALSGVRVLDLAIVLAGPSAGRILAEFGADVIKIDSPRRTSLPWMRHYNWLDTARTKRSMILDLTTDRGKELFREFVANSDVVIENYRSGKMAALGFGYADLLEINPRLINLSINAFDYGGEFEWRPGWEPNAQAFSGLQLAGSTDGTPVRIPHTVNDHATAYLGGFAVMLALRAREQDGRGRNIRLSLSRSASFVQLRDWEWTFAEGHQPAAAAYDIGLVNCSDGAVAYDRAAAGESGLDAEAYADKSCAEAVAQLRKAGIAAAMARTPAQVHDLGWATELGLLLDYEHPHWGPVSNAFSHGVCAGVGRRVGWPSRNPGEDTRSILDDFGYDAEAIDDLLAAGVVGGEVPLFS